MYKSVNVHLFFISETMNNISSFLEADSFLSPPPLRKVDDRFPLDLLCTMQLEETKGNVCEFGILSCIMPSCIQSIFIRVSFWRRTGCPGQGTPLCPQVPAHGELSQHRLLSLMIKLFSHKFCICSVNIKASPCSAHFFTLGSSWWQSCWSREHQIQER